MACCGGIRSIIEIEIHMRVCLLDMCVANVLVVNATARMGVVSLVDEARVRVASKELMSGARFPESTVSKKFKFGRFGLSYR